MTSVRKFNIKTQQFDEVAYEGYKANRTEMPADLAQQIPYIRRALEAFHIPIIQYEGFEADDVIGTLAHKAELAGHKVYIVSNDKDMLQLVTEHVLVLNPVKDNLVLDRSGRGADAGRAAGAGDRCDGAARRLDRQHSGCAGNRRQRIGRTDPAIRLARGGSRSCGGSEAKDAIASRCRTIATTSC